MQVKNIEEDSRSSSKSASKQRSKMSTPGFLVRWFKEFRASSTTGKAPPTIESNEEDALTLEKRRKSRRTYSFVEYHVTSPPCRRRSRTNGFNSHSQHTIKNRHSNGTHIAYTMMPSRSTPNLQQASHPNTKTTTLTSTSSSSATNNASTKTTTTTTTITSNSNAHRNQYHQQNHHFENGALPQKCTSISSSGIIDEDHQSNIYRYLQFSVGGRVNEDDNDDDDNGDGVGGGSPPPAPPVRDSSSLKSIKYGPGHEKYPSWPVPAVAETPAALRVPPGGGSHRSKSWTDHTTYPKEKVVAYTRPYMKRAHPGNSVQQKLKTVMERCEKIPPETYNGGHQHPTFLKQINQHELGGKSQLSVPERDSGPESKLDSLNDYPSYHLTTNNPKYSTYDPAMRPHLTKSDLEQFMEYQSHSYEDSLFSDTTIDETRSSKMQETENHHNHHHHHHHHQKQISYAQSEGYHSYVSSTDSTSTPFLDRLRRESEATKSTTNNWGDHNHHTSTDSSLSVSTCNGTSTNNGCNNSARGSAIGSSNGGGAGRDSVVTTTSSGSVSSSETLKWHGSMSDVSVASSSCTHLAAKSVSSRRLIAHSARVQTPQRHHSESVLYMAHNSNQEGLSRVDRNHWKDKETRNNDANKLKLFPVNTYTVPDAVEHGNSSSNSLPNCRLQNDHLVDHDSTQKFSYLDPEKRHKVPDPTLKAIQKKALLSFYERHHHNSQNFNNHPEAHSPPTAPSSAPSSRVWRSELQVGTSPQPPPRIKVAQLPSRRASSASDYASSNATSPNSKRSSLAMIITSSSKSSQSKTTDNLAGTATKMTSVPRHQYSNSCGSLSTEALLGPVIIGPSISVDDWVPPPPARPPKNPHLRVAFPDLFTWRTPSPDLPPPPPPPPLHTTEEGDLVNCNDEPLPPPPPECENSNSNTTDEWQRAFNERLKDHHHHSHQQQQQPQQKQHHQHSVKEIVDSQNSGGELRLSPTQGRFSGVRSSIRTRPSVFHQVSTSKPYIGNCQANGSGNSGVAMVPDEKNEHSQNGKQHMDFPNQQTYAERSTTRYPSLPKLSMNGVGSGLSGGMGGNLRKSAETASEFNNGEESPPPPPLQPRQMRLNQSMRAGGGVGVGGGCRLLHVENRDVAPAKMEKMREVRSQSLSQSKASYLASRKDKDRIVPDPDIGSYRRTMSPNGHAINPEAAVLKPETAHHHHHNHQQVTNSLWSLTRNGKEATTTSTTMTRTSTSGILRRTSFSDKKRLDYNNHHQNNNHNNHHHNHHHHNHIHNSTHCEEVGQEKKSIILPDVLPVNAKILGTRPGRPLNLSLSPNNTSNNFEIDDGLRSKHQQQTPPHSPIKPPQTTPNTTTPLIKPSLSPSSSSLSSSSPIRVSRASSSSSTSSSLSSSSSNPSLNTNTNTVTNNSLVGTPLDTPQKMSLPSTPPPPPPSSTHSNKHQNQTIHPSITLSSTSTITSQSSSHPLLLSSSPPPPPPSSPPPTVIEGLQLIQRTEVVLRVNAATTDASSQTERHELPPTPMAPRKKLIEEIECEKLSEDFVNHLPSADRLKELLVPGPDYKKPTDYVCGLFKVEVTSRARPLNSPFRSRSSTPNLSPIPPTSPTVVATVSSANGISNQSAGTSPMSSLSSEPSSPLSSASIYFTTSEPKAKFLTRFSQDMSQYHVLKNTKDLNQKKDELVSRLDRKLEVLRSEQLVVNEESKINDELGDNVEAHIRRMARPHEANKFRLHIEEVGKITSLLLGLSGRLARAENALMSMTDDHPDRRILESKRDKLSDQLDEAKKLKECIDRRSVSVSNILYKYLNTEEYTDYDHFINMKAKLLMDSKEISDKIKLGEEQLMALKETLIVND